MLDSLFCSPWVAKVFGDTDAAGVALAKAKELSLTSRTALTKHQNSQAALQADLRTKSKQEGVAAAKVKEVCFDVLFVLWCIDVLGVPYDMDCLLWRTGGACAACSNFTSSACLYFVSAVLDKYL